MIKIRESDLNTIEAAIEQALAEVEESEDISLGVEEDLRDALEIITLYVQT
jgi:hypothetical protein